MPLKLILGILLLSSCAQVQTPVKPHAPKEFSHGEVILGTQLLTKIFDQEMAPVACVPDTDEASLLLRTIRPRMEVVEDDLNALLDNAQEIERLVQTCDQNCTCEYIDDILREHLVTLPKAQRKSLNTKLSEKEMNRCMNFIQTTFCQSDLFKELSKEKVDFSFEEGVI